MQSSRRERGEGRLGCIIGLLIFLSALFVAYKMIPVRVKAADLSETVTSESRAAGSRKEGAIQKNILHRAQELGLPVTAEDIDVQRGADSIRIKVEYAVPIEFPGFTYEWKFRHETDNPIF